MKGKVVTLMQVAEVLELPQSRRGERRRAALRAIRKLERDKRERFLERRGREFVVSVRALEEVADDRKVSLSGIETAVTELGQNQREFKRQLNGHGARIRNLEKWRELTQQYVNACAGLIEPSSSQLRSRTGS